MLATAQREGEVAGVRWSELNGAAWAVSGSRAKNGKPHIVHLSALALEILEAVPRIAGHDLLFSGTGGRPASGFSAAKARLERCMLDALREGDEAADLPPWMLHDLRRRGGLQPIQVP
jgi:integrase